MNNYSEKFEKMRKAGSLASSTLDMITNYIKPGLSTNKIDELCYEFIKDNGGHSAHFIIVVLVNLYAHR